MIAKLTAPWRPELRQIFTDRSVEARNSTPPQELDKRIKDSTRPELTRVAPSSPVTNAGCSWPPANAGSPRALGEAVVECGFPLTGRPGPANEMSHLP